MCPLCPCSGTKTQYGGGGACVPYVYVVVLQHSMEEEEHEPSAAGAWQCDSRSCCVWRQLRSNFCVARKDSYGTVVAVSKGRC